MYYPYLRGRQFELIALREYATLHGDNNNIIPIIEPVKNTFNSMKLAIPKLIEGKVKFALILNPIIGEITNCEEITIALNDELKDNTKWIPAYILKNDYKALAKKISDSNYDEVMLICTEITDTSDDDFQVLISSKVNYIVSKENKSLKRMLSSKKIDLIRLDDNFNGQKRNKDYILNSEEKFSEEHLFYKDDNYKGFSDYTVLVSEFIEGGAAPYAVAIHLTYEKENKEVWVKHFVSDTNDDRSNIQGKFAEAARKAVRFLDEKKIHTEASDELRRYYSDGNGTYPGLGMVKKISIKNHLELINSILSKL